MSVWRLVLRELLFRKANFCLGVVSVAVAVGCLVAQITQLDMYEAERRERMKDEYEATKSALEDAADDYRKITKNMGFNVQILPASQNIMEFYAHGDAAATMPEDYVMQLAKSPLVTVPYSTQ